MLGRLPTASRIHVFKFGISSSKGVDKRSTKMIDLYLDGSLDLCTGRSTTYSR